MSTPFTITVKDIRHPNRTHSLKVRWWTSIKNIKDQLRKIAAPSKIHLFCDSLPIELSNNMTLHDIGIIASGGLLKLAVDGQDPGTTSFSLSIAPNVRTDSPCAEMVESVRLGLERNKNPVKTDIMDSSSGVYFMRDSSGNHKIAVFKPQDEEQGLPHNPKGYSGNGEAGLRPHFTPGHGYIREFVAYLMDVDHFCSVPETTLVHCEHPIFSYSRCDNGLLTATCNTSKENPYPKLGSLQKFVKARDSFEDLGYSKLTDFEVQKIALFDMRILNCDRNAANILAVLKQQSSKNGKTIDNNNSENSTKSHSLYRIQESTNSKDDLFGDQDIFERADDDDVNETKSPNEEENGEDDKFNLRYRRASNDGSGSFDMQTPAEFELIPIDHGYCLPNKLEICDFDWAWYNYPQIEREVHPLIKQYVASLDIEAIISNIQSQVYLSEESAFLLRLVHTLIQDGIAKGLTLKNIADIICRTDFDRPSKLEQIINDAEENTYRNIEAHSSRSSRMQQENDAVALAQKLSKLATIQTPTAVKHDTPRMALLSLQRSRSSQLPAPAGTGIGIGIVDGFPDVASDPGDGPVVGKTSILMMAKSNDNRDEDSDNSASCRTTGDSTDILGQSSPSWTMVGGSEFGGSDGPLSSGGPLPLSPKKRKLTKENLAALSSSSNNTARVINGAFTQLSDGEDGNTSAGSSGDEDAAPGIRQRSFEKVIVPVPTEVVTVMMLNDASNGNNLNELSSTNFKRSRSSSFEKFINIQRQLQGQPLARSKDILASSFEAVEHQGSAATTFADETVHGLSPSPEVRVRSWDGLAGMSSPKPPSSECLLSPKRHPNLNIRGDATDSPVALPAPASRQVSSPGVTFATAPRVARESSTPLSSDGIYSQHGEDSQYVDIEPSGTQSPGLQFFPTSGLKHKRMSSMDPSSLRFGSYFKEASVSLSGSGENIAAYNTDNTLYIDTATSSVENSKVLTKRDMSYSPFIGSGVSPSFTNTPQSSAGRHTFGLPRVVSFGGFISDPVYDLTALDAKNNSNDMDASDTGSVSGKSPFSIPRKDQQKDRLVWKKLLRERRRQVAKSAEFKSLRYRLAIEAIQTVLKKASKEKGRSEQHA